MNNFEEIKLGGKTIYLVGTAHVSDESVKQVQEAIDSVKPDVVAVELCEQRYNALKNEKRWGETEITEVIKSGRIYLFLLQILLANFQRRIGVKVGVKPGAEMLKAVNLAEERGIKVALVDRNIGVTLKRALSNITFKEKAKLLYGFLNEFFAEEEVSKELIERMKNKDVLSELMDELGREAPSLKKVLVDERDEYIALRLSELEARKVVAVLGAGHLEGVKKRLLELKPDVRPQESRIVLEKTEAKKKGINYANYVIPGIFVIILLLGFKTNGTAAAKDMFLAWVLAHSIAASLACIIMLAHPRTIIVAAISAPFTPFHPLVSVGMLCALTEMSARKPRVDDFTALMNMSGLSSYYKNRVVRIFLIMLLADLFNNIGSIIILLYLASII